MNSNAFIFMSKRSFVLQSYFELLNRIKDHLRKDSSIVTQRLNVPPPDVITIGNRTFWRNFKAVSDALRRDPKHIIMVIAKELGTAMIQDEEGKVIIFGKKDAASIKNALNYYIKIYVTCPVCGSPDTKLVKEKKITFLLCEACGAKSPVV